MAAFLTFESAANKVADWIPYLEDCKKTRFIDPGTGATVKAGVEVRPPDVNLSQADFAVVFDAGETHTAHAGHVRFGLGGIKGAGDKAIAAIIEERDGPGALRCSGAGVSSEKPLEGSLDAPAPPHFDAHARERRPYASVFDFCERVLARGPQVMNKATIESLVKSGALDSVHGRVRRAAVCATIEAAMSAGQKAVRDKAAGQGALFGLGGGEAPGATPGETPLVAVAPWSESETLAHEKDVLGFYVSSHPLEAWRSWAGAFVSATTQSCKTMAQDARVVIAGLVQGVRSLVVKSGRSAGQKMAVVTLEDIAGTAEVVVFTDAFAKHSHLVQQDAIVFVLGRVDQSRGTTQIVGERLVPIEGVPLLPGRVRLIVPGVRLNGTGESAIQRAAQLMLARRSEGGDKDALGPPAFPLELAVETPEGWALVAADPKLKVVLDPELVREVCGVLGPQSVRVVGGVALEIAEPKRGWERNGKPEFARRASG
jgi:DNA polymerase-3 subunit alpha